MRKLKVHLKKKPAIILATVLGCVLLCLLTIYLFTPKIKIDGGNDVETVEYMSEYQVSPAEAYRFGQKLKGEVTVQGTVDTKTLGTYYLIYHYGDGLFESKVTKKVVVKDTTGPVITLTGNSDVTMCPNALQYEEEGYQAFDNYDGDITANVEVTEETDKVIYKVKDSSGNETTVERKINRKDETPPTITLTGGYTVYTTINTSYDELGYTATDDCDGDLTSQVVITGNVDTTKLGTYQKTYTVKDSAGNETTVTRTVVVRNQTSSTSSYCGGEPGVIYLTFDDGPNAYYTPVILDVLKKYNVKATFFVTMAGPDSLIKREYEEGHAIGLHTATHQYPIVYGSVDSYFNDLNQVSDRVYRITGMRSNIIRFPGGSSNTVSKKYSPGIMSTLVTEVQNRGYQYFDWNISSGDAGETTDPSVEANNVIKNLSRKCGNIILMHDIKKHTSQAIETIVKYGVENGYKFDVLTVNTKPVHQRVNN